MNVGREIANAEASTSCIFRNPFVTNTAPNNGVEFNTFRVIRVLRAIRGSFCAA